MRIVGAHFQEHGLGAQFLRPDDGGPQQGGPQSLAPRRRDHRQGEDFRFAAAARASTKPSSWA